MKIKLTNDTIVRFAKGSIVDVSDEEAARLIAFNNGVKAETRKTEAKPAKKTK